ncbi:YdcF family protein [Legionella shakespearei]|uniref:Membrane protein n=1 Tax=Legionella shakespearei DSM 23087 TaxID=1122169 RepID=A0A0W0Z7G3_9GAMM|nr:ElyC/SanA/YdcF family protein [Legionella shakespearei]KTD65065.1 membrane protein [Legionella shakespearei DSM 23087]
MAISRHFIEFLVNPFFICFLLLALTLLFVWRGTCLTFVRRTLLLVCLVLLVISTGWLPRYMTHSLESQYRVVTEIDPKVQWIVVLSGGQFTVNGMPANDLLSSASIKRLVEGVRLLRLLPEAKLVLSGGGSTGEQPEAVLMNQLVQWFAISQKQIVLEKQSINTAEQARELAALVKDEPFYLVTSAVHMPRSMKLCQKQGLHPIAAPTDFTFFWNTENWAKLVIPNPYNVTYFSIAMHEVLGRIWNLTT